MSVGDYTDAQVAAWMQGKSPEEVAAAAANLNLDPSAIRDAYALIGRDVSIDDISSYGTQHGYKWDAPGGGLNFSGQEAKNAYADSLIAKGGGQFGDKLNSWVANRPVYLGNATSPNDPNQQLSVQQITNWFKENPNPSIDQLGQMASQYHMTPENVAAALTIGTGAVYNPQAVRDAIGSQSAYKIENDGMISAPGHRSNGLNGAPGQGGRFAQYGADGKGYANDSGIARGTMPGINGQYTPQQLASSNGGFGIAPTGLIGANQQPAAQGSANGLPQQLLGTTTGGYDAVVKPVGSNVIQSAGAPVGALTQLGAASSNESRQPYSDSYPKPVGSMGALMRVIVGQDAYE